MTSAFPLLLFAVPCLKILLSKGLGLAIVAGSLLGMSVCLFCCQDGVEALGASAGVPELQMACFMWLPGPPCP